MKRDRKHVDDPRGRGRLPAPDDDEVDEVDEPRPGKNEPRSTAPQTERAVLAAVLDKQDPRAEKDDPLEELAALAKTAGVQTVPERIVQRRDKPDVTTYVGKGTVERLAALCAAERANVVIFDNDLSPSQRRNLEKLVPVKVIDRTELILDIFTQHARTVQARLQVELAQLEYALPRLRRLWTHLDTGVGKRAAGEKQIEVDKRLVRIRIQEVRDELQEVRARKERQLRARERFTVAIVGYTNAGKSTLMNRLTDAGVYVADKLFATLDTRTKAWEVGPNRVVLLSDTVGFIRQLPHHLVESFHATLEEVVTADLLLHVVDASDPDALEHVRAVRDVLDSLGCSGAPELVVMNKVDRVEQPELLPWLEKRLGRTTRISARTGEGIQALRALVNEYARGREGQHRVRLDVREGAAIAWLEGNSEIISKALDDETLAYEVRCQDQALAALKSKTRDRERLVVETLEAAPPPPVRGEAAQDDLSSDEGDPLASSGSSRLPAASSGRSPAASGRHPASGSARLPTAADDDRHPMSRGISARHRNIHKRSE